MSINIIISLITNAILILSMATLFYLEKLSGVGCAIGFVISLVFLLKTLYTLGICSGPHVRIENLKKLEINFISFNIVLAICVSKAIVLYLKLGLVASILLAVTIVFSICCGFIFFMAR